MKSNQFIKQAFEQGKRAALLDAHVSNPYSYNKNRNQHYAWGRGYGSFVGRQAEITVETRLIEATPL